jgi:hypothetical protein
MLGLLLHRPAQGCAALYLLHLYLVGAKFNL